ncbi:MAG: NADH-quinone oxidoreductase subunit L [SAR202 cluster bacterium Io17-Chloro-G2]|nr:MAG: NADH-quinone oxidoreductase subunit L [SAR202 cluster bacterium Io17-Chloro-G2]
MEWAWLIPVLSFIAAPLIVILGPKLPGKGSFLAILAIAAGFVIFWAVLSGFLGASPDSSHCETSADTGSLVCDYQQEWFHAGLASLDQSVTLTWGTLIDPLTLAMLGLVTFVALMVQVYSLGYMKGDPRLGWYYAVHAMFAGSMLTLVLADNFLLLYMAWELVGICSYLLIGFWHERPAAKEAAKKAFIVTRIGDVGLLVGILLLWSEVGSFSMSEAFNAATTGAMSEGVTTTAALLLLLGAMGKSAQFPFHVWLPDAMEGPTPVSALIHAATMVVAGVYLVARAFPIFQAYDGDALLVVAVVGLVTALMSASIALVSVDLKRILAYSTISHLGLMMLSLGAFGYTAAIFHLLAHGFAKALLFLGAGSVMHSTEAQDIRQMGGLIKVMPITAIVFSVGALSLGGIPLLAGFWSKDEILNAVSQNRNPVFIATAFVVAFMSAFYMARAMFVVFFGQLRQGLDHAHESPWLMTAPMMMLAVLAAGFGLINFNWPGAFPGFGGLIYFHEAEDFHFNLWIGVLSTVLALGAFWLASLCYLRERISPDILRQKAPWLAVVVENKYYFDEVYQWAVDRLVLTVSGFVALFDRAVVNDVGVNGPADTVRRVGFVLRLHVTGHLYSYALAMVLGTVGLAVLWWLRSV